MKKKILFIFSILFTAIIMTSCGANKKPYSLKLSAYGFEKATITNLITKEVTENLFDDIINDNTEFLQWGWLFSFDVGIYEDTEIVFTSDNRCFVLNEGLAYELTGDNTLKLHFPRFQGYDYGIYDVVIVFGNQKLYG